MYKTIATLLASLLTVMAFAAPSQASLPEFTKLVEANSPAVVKILSIKSNDAGIAGMEGVDPRALEQMPEMFKHFFGYPGRQGPRRQQQSMGSGFLISDDGYIVTNHHVIDGADKVLVRLPDRREFDAEIVGTDKRSDIALLKVAGEDLPHLGFGDDESLKVGEWVVAIGSPFGLDYSVSAGIVSAMGRSIPNEDNENYVPFIQTDVAINPGNSGGPLFNLEGEVVGVNSQIYTRSGGSIGLSFAIPATVVADVVSQLRENGAVRRGWLGVGIQEVDRKLAESFGLDKPRGALISQVGPDSPAEKGGIEAGDIIVAFDGKPIDESADLPHVVGLTKPGTSVPVLVIRNGKEVEIDVEVGALDGEEAPSIAQVDAVGGRLGLVVDDLSEPQRKRLKLRSGVVVREVLADSPAARAGLQPNDVLTSIGNETLRSAEQFDAIAATLPANTHIPVRILRRGLAGFVAIRIEE